MSILGKDVIFPYAARYISNLSLLLNSGCINAVLSSLVASMLYLSYTPRELEYFKHLQLKKNFFCINIIYL